MDKTIVAIATPPGRGGLAVLRISGESALEIADKVICLKNSKNSIRKMSGYTAAYGQVIESGQVVDDVVVLVFKEPNSYTGEDTVEISCHGGEWVCNKILSICLKAGAEMAAGGEFTRRAFLNNKLTLSQAEGVLELISANSTQQAICARAMLTGKKNMKIKEIREDLLNQLTHLSAWIDYPEEDVEGVEEKAFLDVIRKCRVEIDDVLVEYYDRNKMKNGINAVIFGNPNVGKSTIFNALLGEERAITTPIAGTTRDVLKDNFELQGFPLCLFDTAGIRSSSDPIEIEGIKKTNQKIEEADVLLAVFDASDTQSFDSLIAYQDLKIPTIGIYNKHDLTPNFDISTQKDKFDCVVLISAKDNPTQAEKKIIDSIVSVLQLKKLDPNYMTIINDRQEKALQRVQEELQSIESESKFGILYDIAQESLFAALHNLNIFDGENLTEEMIDHIFANFCVGK